MYEAFYGLSEKPFNLTPDPRYLFLSEKHKEAFAHLLYGIKNGSGFVMVTGEIGTGKTTICRNLVRQLDEETELAFIFNPALQPVELIRKVLTEFGREPKGDNVLDLVEELNAYLLEAKAAGKNCVLLIDEAQNLSPQVLEQIRLLSNLETETEKLLQIVLVGQPELGEMLALKELRQLNQRITARYHLRELSDKEVLQYVAYRLHVAGGRRTVRFNRGAVRHVYKRSGGTPRVVNAICDRALLIGYTKEAHIITKAIVRQAANEIRGEKVKVKRRKTAEAPSRGWLAGPSWIAALALLIAVGVFSAPRISELLNRPQTPAADNQSALPQPAVPGTVEAKTEAPPEPGPDTPEPEEQLASSPAASAAEPAPAPAAEEPIDPQQAFAAASKALLSVWGVDAGPADSMEALIAAAEEQGMTHEAIAPALTQIVAMGYPALIRVDDGREPYWFALLGAEDGRVWLSDMEGGEKPLSQAALASIYADEAVVLWRDPDPEAPDLVLGRSGPHVTALKDGLRRLGRLSDTATADAYDARTATAVSKLQAETGLQVDGIAGRQVRMVMSSWLPEYETPSLHRSAGPAVPLPMAAPKKPVTVAARVARTEAPAAPPAPDEATTSDQEPTPAPEAASDETPAPPSEAPSANTPPEPAEAPATDPGETAEARPSLAPEPITITNIPPRGSGDNLVEMTELSPLFPSTAGPSDPDALKETTPPAPTAPLAPGDAE